MFLKKILLLILILTTITTATDFNISTTNGFNSGVKLNTSTITDEYNWTSNTFGLSFPYAVKDDNLVNYFRYENNLIDETGASTGTASGTVTYVDGKYGKAFDTSSGTNYISYSPILFNQASYVTFSAWVKLNSITGDKALFGHWSSSTQQFLIYHDDPYGWRFVVRDNTNTLCDSGYNNNGASPTNEWLFITGTYNKDGNISLYVNGELVAQNSQVPTGNPLSDDPTDFYIGIDGSDLGRNLNGLIDEVKIYNRTLNSSEVSDLYNSGKQYKEIGTWTSPTQTIFNTKKMSNTTIEGTNLNISKVQWLKASDSSILAEYDNSITSNTTITNSMLTSGSFDNVINDYKIKIFLQDNSSITPEVQQVYGYYDFKKTPDFLITTTNDYNSGNKINTSTATDEYNITSNTLGLSFPYAVKDDNLVNYFRYENNLNDKVGNNNGTASGAVTYVNGKYGKAFSTSSGTNYINYGNASFNETESVTFSAWIYPTTTDTYQYILASGGETSAEGIAMRWRGDTHTIFVGRNTLTSKIQLAGVGNVPANEWTLITGVYNSSANNLKLYINGTYIGTGTSTAETYTRNLNLTVGTNADQTHGQYPFYSYIDEVKIYTKALTSSEVSDLYNSGKQYKEIGTWESASQVIPWGYRMSNTTIEGTKLNVTKIQWIRTNDSKLMAEYNNTITNSTTITNSMLTSGNFTSLIDDFKIKIFLQDNSSITPEVTQLYGYYTPIVSLTHPTNTETTCNHSQLITTTTYGNGATLTENKTCQFGCSNGACLNPSTSINLIQTTTLILFLLLLSPIIILFFFGKINHSLLFTLLFVILTILFSYSAVTESILGLPYTKITTSLTIISSFFIIFFAYFNIREWLDNKKEDEF